jgi:hypothetical protein
VGPTYIDRNIAGTRLTLTASARALFARDSGHAEGSSSNTVLRYPLFSLASKWGAALGAAHSDAVGRSFLGNRLRTVDLNDTPQTTEALPWIYRVRSFSSSASATRSFQTRLIQRVQLGYGFSVVRPSFTGDFPSADPAVRADFARQIFPRSERVSDLFAGYSFFQPRYVIYRDLDTFDLREDRTLGPSGGASAAVARRALGSDRDFVSVAANAGWSFDLAGGLQNISAGWGGRIQSGSVIDQTYSAGFYAASPMLWRVVRVVASGGATVYVDDTQNRFLGLGGDSGLRGYQINDLFGKTSAIGHVEVRSQALSVASFRLGGLVFYDVGDAATPDQGSGFGLVRAVRGLRRLHPHNDVGLGARLLIPQLNAYVLRFDWAFPLNSTDNTPAGLPGRFSAGFQQTF